MSISKSLLVLIALIFSVVSCLIVLPFMLIGMVCLTYSQAVDGRDGMPDWVDASIDALTEPVHDFAAWVHEMFGHIK